jgi:hypothetical protein
LVSRIVAAEMKPSLDGPCFSRRARAVALWISICLPLYGFSTGPVAWATNDAFHPRYFSDELNYLYLPLAPPTKVECVNDLFYWWTAVRLIGRAPSAGTTPLNQLLTGLLSSTSNARNITSSSLSWREMHRTMRRICSRHRWSGTARQSAERVVPRISEPRPLAPWGRFD